MRLLVTRPQPDAGETARRLVELGHRAEVCPLFEMVFHPEPGALTTPSGIAVTSRNGVRALQRWPSARGWHGLPVYAVGEATADTARRAGFGDVRSADGDGDGAALADLIRRNHPPSQPELVYPAGRDRAIDLGALLSNAGITLVTVEAYHARAAEAFDQVTLDLIARRDLDGVLVFSRRAAAVLAKLITEAGLAGDLGGMLILAISAAAAEPLAGLDFAGVQIAEKPNEKSVLALAGAAATRP